MISDFPSPSISAVLIPRGNVPEVKSTFVAREVDVIVPAVEVFLRIEIVLLTEFETAMSNLASPS